MRQYIFLREQIAINLNPSKDKMPNLKVRAREGEDSARIGHVARCVGMDSGRLMKGWGTRRHERGGGSCGPVVAAIGLCLLASGESY